MLVENIKDNLKNYKFYDNYNYKNNNIIYFFQINKIEC